MTDPIAHPSSRFPFAYVHREGCGYPAFYLTERPAYGSPMRSRIARRLNGEPMGFAAPAVCGHCGGPLSRGLGGPPSSNIHEMLPS